MDKKEIKEGEIVTTKEAVKQAVKQAVSCLYDDNTDFHNNRYMTAKDREFEQLSEQQQDDVANDVLDYLLDE